MSNSEAPVEPAPETLHAAARLRRQVEWAEGFWLAYVFASSPPQVHLLQQELEIRMAELGRNQRVLRPASPEELEQCLGEILRDGQSGCTWVEAIRGGGSTTSEDWAAAWSSFILRANERRELIRFRLNGGLIFVAHPEMKADLRRAAPDLWSIRAFVFELRAGSAARGDRFESLEGLVKGRRERPRADVELLEADLARLDELLADRTAEDTVQFLLRVAQYLVGSDRASEAVEFMRQAITILQSLVPTDADRALPALAHALNELGVTLAGTGRWNEALDASSEALMIRRELAKAKPEAFTLDLARALNNLGFHLLELGRPREALAAVQEGLGILEGLDKNAQPGLDGSDRAKALINLGWILQLSGRPDEALAVTQEAVKILREPVRVETDERRGDLATSLNNVSNMLLSLGRYAEALEAASEGVAILRELDAVQPHAWKPDLAMSLHSLALALVSTGPLEDAKGASEESLEIRRELANTHPDAFEPALASSLGLLGWIQRERGEFELSQASLHQGLELLRPHYRRFPDAFQDLWFELLDDLERTCRASGVDVRSAMKDYLPEP